MLGYERQQRAVGQGFFHTGVVSFGRSEFHYIYDCGSESPGRLVERMREYADGLETGRVAALFVSHLDDDHVSGLDQLLGRIKVETVFLPYVTPAERVMILAEAVGTGKSSANLVQCISDPVRWFVDRGADRVVFVVGSDEGPAPEIPDPPPLPDEDDAEATETRIHLDDRNLEPERGQSGAASLGGFFISHTTPIPLLDGAGGLLNWMFLTFVHPEGERVGAFQSPGPVGVINGIDDAGPVEYRDLRC